MQENLSRLVFLRRQETRISTQLQRNQRSGLVLEFPTSKRTRKLYFSETKSRVIGSEIAATIQTPSNESSKKNIHSRKRRILTQMPFPFRYKKLGG
jgi:hypothetical protein